MPKTPVALGIVLTLAALGTAGARGEETGVVPGENNGAARLDAASGGGSAALPPIASASAPRDRRAAAVEAFVGPFVELAMFDGTILVDAGGEIVYRGSFGLASYEHRVPHHPGTRFRIASVSKTLTDAAFAVLLQRGTLTLETPLADYLPEFPSAGTITVGHLLGHSSGIPHTNDQPWGDGATSFPLDELVRRLAALPLDFPPGSDRRYSNGGYAVAAKVLELAGGAPFGEVLRQTVLEPLGMADTGHIEDARHPIPDMAAGYEPGPEPGRRRLARFYAVETRAGGGSLYSTADDLLRFARGVFREGFVAEPLRREVLGADEEPFLSQGRSPGFVAKLLYRAADDVIVVSLANSYAVPADWATVLADLATGRIAAAPWPSLERAAGAVAPDDPRLGRYRTSFGSREVGVERTPAGGLVLREGASPAVTGLVPLADGAFLLPSYFQRCAHASENRRITCSILSGNELYTSVWTPLDG